MFSILCQITLYACQPDSVLLRSLFRIVRSLNVYFWKERVLLTLRFISVETIPAIHMRQSSYQFNKIQTTATIKFAQFLKRNLIFQRMCVIRQFFCILIIRLCNTVASKQTMLYAGSCVDYWFYRLYIVWHRVKFYIFLICYLSTGAWRKNKKKTVFQMILLTTTYSHCSNVCCHSHIYIQRKRNIGEIPPLSCMLYTVYYSLHVRTKRNETDLNK